MKQHWNLLWCHFSIPTPKEEGKNEKLKELKASNASSKEILIITLTRRGRTIKDNKTEEVSWLPQHKTRNLARNLTESFNTCTRATRHHGFNLYSTQQSSGSQAQAWEKKNHKIFQRGCLFMWANQLFRDGSFCRCVLCVRAVPGGNTGFDEISVFLMCVWLIV